MNKDKIQELFNKSTIIKKNGHIEVKKPLPDGIDFETIYILLKEIRYRYDSENRIFLPEDDDAPKKARSVKRYCKDELTKRIERYKEPPSYIAKDIAKDLGFYNISPFSNSKLLLAPAKKGGMVDVLSSFFDKKNIYLAEEESILCKTLAKKGYKNIINIDLLNYNEDQKFDYIVIDASSYENWEELTLHAANLLNPDIGILRAIVPAKLLKRLTKKSILLYDVVGLSNRKARIYQTLDSNKELVVIEITANAFTLKNVSKVANQFLTSIVNDHDRMRYLQSFSNTKEALKKVVKVVEEKLANSVVDYSTGHVYGIYPYMLKEVYIKDIMHHLGIFEEIYEANKQFRKMLKSISKIMLPIIKNSHVNDKKSLLKMSA